MTYAVELISSAVTVEDLARALASLDGKEAAFDAEKGMSAFEAVDGHYLGYSVEMQEIIRRANDYAKARNQKAG